MIDYILYTPQATYFDRKLGGWIGPVPEIVAFSNAEGSSVLDEPYSCSDAFTSMCFWLGHDGVRS